MSIELETGFNYSLVLGLRAYSWAEVVLTTSEKLACESEGKLTERMLSF